MRVPGPRGIVREVVSQHVEEAAFLADRRRLQVRAGNMRLRHLARLDERLAAHLDGIAVAGDAGEGLCTSALARPTHGVCFVAAACAIQRSDGYAFDRLLRAAAADPTFAGGVAAALRWSDAVTAKPLVAHILSVGDRSLEALALNVAIAHGIRVDADRLARTIGGESCEASVAAIRLSTLQRVGGPHREIEYILSSTPHAPARLAAAQALYLAGERDLSPGILGELAIGPGPSQVDALVACMRLFEFERAVALLASVRDEAGGPRAAIVAAGGLGDIRDVPWLVTAMSKPALARVAGEAFATVTGADLALLDLDRPPDGESELPGDDTTEPAEADATLPTPDVRKLESWWHAAVHRFPLASRVFVGGPVSKPHLERVLRHGWQRERATAAELLFLRGDVQWTFDVDAPSDRQRMRLGLSHDDLVDSTEASLPPA